MDEHLRSTAEHRLTELRRALADLQSRWPAHSVKPEMHRQLEKLEEEIEELQKQLMIK